MTDQERDLLGGIAWAGLALVAVGLFYLATTLPQEKSQTWNCWQEGQHIRRCKLVEGQP